MRAIFATLSGLILAGCATAPPHPQIGVVWATIATVTTASGAAGASSVAYAVSRSLCESTRDGAVKTSAKGAVWGDCTQRAVVPYRDGAGGSIYWTFAAGDMFAMGSSERALCLGIRAAIESEPSLRVVALGDCERVIVTPLR